MFFLTLLPPHIQLFTAAQIIPLYLLENEVSQKKCFMMEEIIW